MDNFHYRGPNPNPKSEKSAKLMEELQQIDRQLEEDNRRLAEKKRLEEEFYEDSNRMNLADEIMNELLSKKAQSNKNPNQPRIPQEQGEPAKYSPNPQEMGYRVAQNVAVPPPKPVEYVNPRELEKLKLQNKNAQQEFPFGGNSREKERRQRNEYDNPTRISPEREPLKSNNYVVPQTRPKGPEEKAENPFIKNDQQLKEKREEQEKNYRRLLEEQMEEQRRKKESEKQKYKEEIQQKYNNYTPATGATSGQSPLNEVKPAENVFKKRRDPNAQWVSLEKPSSEIRSSDLEFMKLQVQDIKNKFKKGRINHEEHDQQIKKLENHYKFKVEELGLDDNEDNPARPDNREAEKQPLPEVPLSNNSDRIRNSRLQPNYQMEKKENESLISKSKATQNYQPHPQYINTSVPIEAVGPRQPVYPNYSQYPQMGQMGQAGQGDFQMQIMFKLLDEFKNMFRMQTETMINDKRVLQDTLTKMIPAVNPIMLTQQVPPTQLPPPAKEFHTEAKKPDRFDGFPKPSVGGIEYSAPQSSESEISSSYIEKSMSGIVNKIPLTRKQKEEDKPDSHKDLHRFYERKYKVKKFKGFEYKEVDNQSNIVIPSVSNFLQSKNAHNELNQAFERDLKNYKKLEKDREMQLMMDKIKKSKQAPVEPSPSPKKVIKTETVAAHQATNFYQPQPQSKPRQVKEQPVAVNPFLKKHISGESNHSQSQPQLQTRQQVERVQMINSPTPKNEILEQEEYQTEPRKSESPSHPRPPQGRSGQSTYNPEPQGRKEYPSSKILNTVRENNEILAKYEMTPPHGNNIGSNSLSSIKEMVRVDSSKELSSREYFSGHEISPVQRREYESSLETVRSQEESAKFERKNNMDLLMMRSPGSSNFSSQYQSHHPMGSIQGSPTIESIEVDKRQAVAGNIRNEDMNPNMGYSQTVESIEESSSKLPSFQKPPNNSKKNGRSVSRKKESVVKVGNSDNFQKSGLSGIPSEGSREKSSENRNSSAYDNLSKMEAPKFDSAVYESAYEQSISLGQPKAREVKVESQFQDSKYLAPSSFKEVLQRQDQHFAEQQQNQSGSYQPQQQFYVEEGNPSNAKKSNIQAPVPKFKSLDSARKIAREFRHRAGEDHNRSSVEEKLSELESMIQTNKKDESMMVRRDEPASKKKDIMKILDNLDEEDYEPDFQSYKQDSER